MDSVRLLFFVGCLGVSASVVAQLPTGWRAHDWDRPQPPVVAPGGGTGSDAPSLPPPSDAVVLFSGSDLSEWRDSDGNEAKWIVRDGVMESIPGSGYVFTRKSFGDVQLHVEWASPANVVGNSQGRGNSGVFLMGQYEVQVLDSFENRTYADGQAGSLYGQFPPLVNASREPGKWQAFDIVFRRPRFGADGVLLSPARFTVLHNGILVQDNVTALGPTKWLQHLPYQATEDALPIALQDHGNPVRYRNIWVRRLDEYMLPWPTKPYDSQVEQLSTDELANYVGEYIGESSAGDSFKVIRRGRHLELEVLGRPLELITRSKTEFGLRYTAAAIEFTLDDTGKAVGMSFEMGPDKRSTKRKIE